MDHEVVIAGGGPVGLLLACELGLAGVSVLVAERGGPQDRELMDQRALNLPTIEALDRRGLLDGVRKAQANSLKMFGLGREEEPLAHFALIFVGARDIHAEDPELARHRPFADCGVVGLYELRTLLAARAAELGVEVRYGAAVTGVAADEHGVEVDLGGHRVRTQWLVGCDGSHSAVRKLAGFDFPGVEPEFTTRHAMVELDRPELMPLELFTDAGMLMHAPIPDGPHLLGLTEFGRVPADRNAPVTLEEVQASLDLISGSGARITRLHTASRYTDTTRQASTYRRGRVLLAGDAAHVHPPFGGQGLNLGFGDAVNLGWKLAATLRGWAQPGLLDTYTSERHPVGKWVQDWTMAQTALLRPDPRSRALRTILRDLLNTRDGATYVVRQVSGAWQDQVPDLGIAEHFRDGRGVLVSPRADARLAELAQRWRDRVNVVTAEAPENLLIRPDGVLAWRGDDLIAAETAFTTWFGTVVR
ncbi:FAD-dependent oxidoreductase [Kutzneria albida]|uniref:FAD-dependent oxidoreductase n=1 Tax=Kutzneria albida DSM 43870 TaxID=1449976 RepID=W5W1Q1_9PSEU|nr:FAD-dependent oxidoreductase [Kutzneria albida]AHH94700.1 FAD-dependent oxidoreductase [Kutzneria albida DSM 43870]